MESVSLWQETLTIARRYGLSRAFALWVEGRVQPESMQAWRQFLRQSVPADAYGAMLLRPLRPYMRQNFSVEQRRRLIQDHLMTMQPYFAQSPQLKAEPGLIVATLEGKQGAHYHITLGGNTSKEGEMTIGFYDSEKRYLAKMEGSIGHNEAGEKVFWIGGLQGAKPPMGRDEVVKATRDCYGLRPKGAVMLVAQTLAQHLGLTALYGPGNEEHISQRGLKKISKKRKIHADYAEFWEEIGGAHQTQAGDEYVIPIIPQVRDISEVKQNKRSEWKKRQALSEAMVAQVWMTLGALRHPKQSS